MQTGERSVAPWEPERTRCSSASANTRRRWVIPPECTTLMRMKSMSCSRMSGSQSQIVLNTSPSASGVVVCDRTTRSASGSSAGTGSSR